MVCLPTGGMARGCPAIGPSTPKKCGDTILISHTAMRDDAVRTRMTK
jgi:hypothetical protein